MTTRAIVHADVDSDGDVDLFFANSGGFAGAEADRLWINDGQGGFVDESATRLPKLVEASIAASFGDIDRDGDPDLVVATLSATRLRILINHGGRFVDETSTRIAKLGLSFWSADVDLGDLDGDGDLDLFAADAQWVGGEDRWFVNDGKGKFVAAARLPGTHELSYEAKLLDANGDGRLDVFVAGQRGLRFLLANGRGGFVDASRSLPSRATAGAFVVDDFDGNGADDILLGAWSASRVGQRFWLADGLGGFVDVTSRLPKADWSNVFGLACADFDGDGILDVLMQTDKSPALRLWRGTKTGFVADSVVRLPRLPVRGATMLVADLDQDLDVDLVHVEDRVRGSAAKHWRNVSLQVVASGPARIGKMMPTTFWVEPGYSSAPATMLVYTSLRRFPSKIRLGTLGYLGADPSFGYWLPPILVPAPSGEAKAFVQLPNAANLRGLTLTVQGLYIRGIPTSWHLSNVWEGKIQ